MHFIVSGIVTVEKFSLNLYNMKYELYDCRLHCKIQINVHLEGHKCLKYLYFLTTKCLTNKF